VGETGGYAQTVVSKYISTTTAADSLFARKDYRAAVHLYDQAFKANNGLGKIGHRYKAAACYAQLNMADSAFSQLNTIAGKGKFSHYDMTAGDSSFEPLHNDPRWATLLNKILENRKKKIIIDN
jgi:hypothetical protein